IVTRTKHRLVIYSIPARGFTAVVSVFRGTPPPKPLECKFWLNTIGALLCERWDSPSVENLGPPAPVLILCRLTSSRCRLRFVHRAFTFRCRCRSFRENKKPCLLCGKQGLKILWIFCYLLTSGLSKFVSGACPLYDLDRPRLNTQPWLNRL